MRWNVSIFKRLVAVVCVILSAATANAITESDSIAIKKYEQRLQTRLNRWKRLIPNLFTVQYAGGTGMFSVGPGWDYGSSNQWETSVLIGYLPRKYSHPHYWSLTVKENYLPWRIAVGHWPVEVRPLAVSVSINSVLHGDFWASEPDRYPSGYYGFSSRVRFHLGLGQRFTFNIPPHKRYLGRQFSIYYEVSTCDLYVRQKILNHRIPLKDIITLGLGIMYTI